MAEKEIQKLNTEVIKYLTPTGIKLPEGTTIDEWRNVGRFIQYVRGASDWWLGDWWDYGEKKFGKTISRNVILEIGIDVGQADVNRRISRIFEDNRRRPELSFAHHKAVEGRDPWDQDRLLAQASQEQISEGKLRSLVADSTRGDIERRSKEAIERPSRRNDILTVEERLHKVIGQCEVFTSVGQECEGEAEKRKDDLLMVATELRDELLKLIQQLLEVKP